jgi:hypothetical protein
MQKGEQLMKKMNFGFALFFLLTSLTGLSFAELTLTAKKIDQSPIIDGNGSDAVWSNLPSIVTHDPIADIDITLKAAYTRDHILLLLSFPDPDESRFHEGWIWQKDAQRYEPGPYREDVCVLKWSLDREKSDLSIRSSKPHTADIWFWKAHRSDPMGYADDMIHVYAAVELPNARKIISQDGQAMYLQRLGDSGESMYENIVYDDYQGDELTHFKNRRPSGSRADIRARGGWADGIWTIEILRTLQTGHEDDVQFDVQQRYPFGISRYGIGGLEPERDSQQPLFSSGDVSEVLFLIFEEGPDEQDN